MKSNSAENAVVNEHIAEGQVRPGLASEERTWQHQQDKAFIKAMNEFTAKAGLLSDDPYFGGI